MSKLNREILKIKKDAMSEIKDLFAKESKNIFDKYPNVKSFGWDQYNYYNDNWDEFSVFLQSDCIRINGYDVEGYGASDEDSIPENEENPISEAIYEEISDMLEEFCDKKDKDNEYNIFSSLFGMNVKVEVTRNGIATETCHYR
jgi:hypothetical protein